MFWMTKKTIMAMSTTDTEYVALAMNIQIIDLIKRMLTDSKTMPDEKFVLRTDNQATFAVAGKAHGTKSPKIH